MKVEIHIRDTNCNGKRVGMRNAFVESVRVFKESGDGLRLDNLAPLAQGYFKAKSLELVDAWKRSMLNSKTT